MFGRLQELGIRPTLHEDPPPQGPDSGPSELIQEIVRRAEDMERAWQQAEQEEAEHDRPPQGREGGWRPGDVPGGVESRRRQ